MAVYVPGLVSVIVFYVIFLLLGLWAAWKSRKVTKNSEDVLLAGRSIGMLLGIFTMTATWVEGGFINGTAEGVYSGGLVGSQAPFAYSVCLGVQRMRQNGYATIIDPFQQKYGDMMGALLYIISLSGDVFVVAAILGALGSTLSVVLNIDYNISVIVAACVAVLYTFFGGLFSVAYTDVLQLIFMFFGVWLIIPFAISNDAVRDLSTNYTDVWVKELDPSTAGVYIDGWLQMILGAIPWQVYFQRVLAAKSAYIAELLSYLGVIGCFIVVIPSLLVGIIATQTDWSMTTYMSGNSSVLADEDIPLVLPLVMEHLCPKAVALFGLGAVAAAVMSSVDSAVLSSSGQFSRNVYKRIIRKTASEREQIWVLRASTIVFGVIATSVSIYVRSIYALWVLCSDIIYVILFPQLTCAIYFSSANTYGSFVAFIVGLFFRVAGGEKTLGLDPIIRYPWHKVDDDGTVVQLFPHKTLSMLLSLFSLLFVSWFTNWLFDNGILSPKFDILRKHPRTKYKNKYVISTSDGRDVKEKGNYKINAAFTTDAF
ncbi:solute carrier family 5 (high affinity choline transporter), member 7 [Mytilus galloprovincialis]|uniref:Solute carrier family 5 (High affinity choline transporter), member 7 n=1 Tax=Mytilus galloprovincialis TaxID=29158 RepID=A0A8B6FP13_MYTGA|nr:solute carrier family 5 (high affinity choline transporter), member 7 [Mytilus galloprovincialis]